jgi:HlyD family secretion protein
MEVIGDVSEDQAALVRPGQRVRVSLPGGERQGRVKAVASQAEKGDGGNVVKTSIEVPQSRDLLPNSSVGLEIVVNERKAVLTLPRGPYLASGSERVVYRLIPGVQRAERREVVFGARDATRVEILRGLDEGDRVVTSSYDAFKDQPLIEVSPQGELR